MFTYLHAAILHFTILYCTSITCLKMLWHTEYSAYMPTVRLYMLCLFVHHYVMCVVKILLAFGVWGNAISTLCVITCCML